MPEPQQTVSAIAVVDLARVLSNLGAITLDAAAGFAPELAAHIERLEAGVDMSDLFQRRFPEAWLQKLWALGTDSGRADLGLRVGRLVEPRAQGLLASWVGHCETLREALQLYTNRVALLNASDGWLIRSVGEKTILTSTLSSHESYPTIACERSLVALVAWGRHFTSDQLKPVKVDLRSRSASHIGKLQEFFGCPVSSGQPYNRLHIANTDLSQPINSANAYLKSVLDDHISRLGLAQDNPTTAKVQQLLHNDLIRFANAENTSTALFMSRATLYRKLNEEGTTFSKLRDAERRFRAARMEGSSAEEIAHQLGYGDCSAYYKALKRWGQTEGKLEKS